MGSYISFHPIELGMKEHLLLCLKIYIIITNITTGITKPNKESPRELPEHE